MKNDIELNSEARLLRKKWGQDSETPIDVFALAGLRPEVTIVNLEMHEDISGLCIKDGKSIVIGINSDMSYGRQRYTLAHELYHGFADNQVVTYVCDKQFAIEKPDIEKEADAFASYFLIPYEALIQYADEHAENGWTQETVVCAEQYFQVSHQAFLIRLIKQGFICDDEYELLRNISVTRVAVELGFSTKLYRKTADDDKFSSTGEYIRKIEEAYERNLIGAGKRRELLLDGFSLGVESLVKEGNLVIDD